MELQMDSPRPVPFPSGALVKKGSKMLSRSSWEIPTPVSVTRTNTSLATRWAKMSTVPPFGMAFMALGEDVHRPAVRHGIHGVEQQVDEHLFQETGNTENLAGLRREVCADFDILDLGLAIHQGQRRFHRLKQVQGRPAFVRRRMGKTQQVLNDGAGFADTAVDLFGALPAKLRGKLVFAEELCGRGGNRQGRSDFVRDSPGHHAESGQFLRFKDRSEENTSELQSPCNFVCGFVL